MKGIKNLIKILNIVFFAYLLLMLSPPIYCSATGLPVGAKYIALGGQVNYCDDVYSIYYNPASVDHIVQHQVAAEYTGMFLGLSESISRAFLGYVMPTKKIGSFGVYWTNLQASTFYSENTIAFIYSKNRIFTKRLSVGVRPKIYYVSFGKQDGIYDNDGFYYSGVDSAFANKSSKVAFGVDFGANFALAQNYVFGLQISDVNQPNISLFNTPDVVLPMKILFGIANINKTYGLNLDIGLKEKDIVGSFGVQYKILNEKLRLYGSVKFTSRNYDTKNVILIEPSFGTEFVFDGFNIAYAFNYPISGLELFGNHTFSISYKFGPVVKLPEDTTPLYAKITKLEEQLKQKDAEIEELKRKLDELLSKPAPVQKQKKEEKPKEKELKPQEKPTETLPPAEKKLEEMTPKEKYEYLWNKYSAMKEQLTIVDRIKTVDVLIKQFKGQTDISKAQKELNELLKLQKQAEDELKTSKNYYYKLKTAGTSKAELKSMLQKIKKRFEGYGLDTNWIDEELKKLE